MNQTLDDHSPRNELEQKRTEKRKNKSSKATKNTDDIGKNTKVEKPSENDLNIIHYAHKLEYRLASTREKIKSEKKKFQQIVSGLVNYLGENGGATETLKTYLKIFDSSHEAPATSNFEKLFTTSKYQIIEESENTISKKPIAKIDNQNEKELPDSEDQKLSGNKKTKQKNEATSKPRTKKQKSSKTVTKEDHPKNDEDDVEILEVPPPPGKQFQIPTLDPFPNLFQSQNLSAEQLGTLLNQQAYPNDVLQSYLMLQAKNPIQGLDLSQYEKFAQEMMKMGGNPQQYYK